MRDRLEIYLQFDGLEDAAYTALRGEALLETKLAALEALQQHDLRCTLVCTVDHNVNLHEVGRVLRFGLERPIVRGVSFQLATYCGRHLESAATWRSAPPCPTWSRRSSPRRTAWSRRATSTRCLVRIQIAT